MASITNIVPLGHGPSGPAYVPPMPGMSGVPTGTPNMFSQNGYMNTQQNTTLPNAFTWRPYTSLPDQYTTLPNAYANMPGVYSRNPYVQSNQGSGEEYHPYHYYGGYGGRTWNTQPSGTSTQTGAPPVTSLQSTPPRQIVTTGPTATVTNIAPITPARHHHYHFDQGPVIDESTVTILDNGDFDYPYYSTDPNAADAYPDVYSGYDGMPSYIYSPDPGVEVVGTPYYPQYATNYTQFDAPQYQATYNQNNYYVNSPQAADDIDSGGAPAQQAVKSAYDEDTYQAAFADIEQAWTTGDVELIRKHLRDNDTKINVLINRKYSYSISSADFSQITRDAMKNLSTISFKFTRLRKAKNGDITAYGVHVYQTGDNSDSGSDDTVPFDTSKPSSDSGSGSPAPTDNAPAADKSDNSDDAKDAAGNKTMFVSYTLRKEDDGWVIVIVDSSTKKLVPSQSTDQPAEPGTDSTSDSFDTK